MFNIVLCDDEKNYSDILMEYLKKTISMSRYGEEKFCITLFNDPAEAEDYCLNNQVHILFLDIDMPVINGFDVANAVRKEDSDVKIIFVSAFENLVYTSFRYRPFRFIRKSRIKEELPEAFTSAMDDLLYKEMYITIINQSENYKVFYSDICIIESKANYADITTADGSKKRIRSTMNSLEKKLCGNGFIRIHSGYIVSMSKIRYFRTDSVEMNNGEIISVSRKYYQSAREAFRKYLRDEL